MRRTICFILVSLALAGCGESQTPLSHALSALRAGDHADFLKAKLEAEEDYKKAIQPGGDLCLVTPADIVRYHAKYVVEKMDDAEVFTLPEEDRLLFALKFAGKHSVIHPETYIANAMIAGGMTHFDAIGTAPSKGPCDGKQEQFQQAMMAQNNVMLDDEAARSAVLESWIDQLNAKHGDKFVDQMRSAANHLDAHGYSVQWPVPAEFADGRTL